MWSTFESAVSGHGVRETAFVNHFPRTGRRPSKVKPIAESSERTSPGGGE